MGVAEVIGGASERQRRERQREGDKEESRGEIGAKLD
jgi:hypothetical protein